MTDQSGISFGLAYTENRGDIEDVTFFAAGVAAGDFDSDQDIDLFIVRGDVGSNRLYRNDGNNVFVDVAAIAGLAFTKTSTENFRHSGPVFGDLDGDGDLDLFVGGVQGDPSLIFSNNGDGTFTNVTVGSGIDSMRTRQTISAALGDYDLDGDLDLLMAHWGAYQSVDEPGETEHLWRNVSDGSRIRFESVTLESGISPSIITLADPRSTPSSRDHTFAPSLARLDGDWLPDFLMVADFNKSMVFLNNGNSTFSNMTDVEVIADTNGMGSALGDYDNDGDLDWFVTSIFRETGTPTPNGNRLYRNDGGVFSDVSEIAGIANGGWGWGACFLDIDNDGDLDIYHTNGWPRQSDGDFSKDASRLFVSDGAGGFVDQAEEFGLADNTEGRGVVCADFDNDGDVDIFLISRDADNAGRLYRNDADSSNFLSVKLRGLPPNTEAVGARIKVTVGSESQIRETLIASNFVSHNPTEQLFGLGSASQVDSLIIEWPDGAQTDLGPVLANQKLVIDHPGL